MESVSGKYWEESKINQRIFEKIKSENNFTDIVNKLILIRNFNREEIFTINNKIKIINPFLKINDFQASYVTLKKTIEKNKFYSETLVTHKSSNLNKIIKLDKSI